MNKSRASSWVTPHILRKLSLELKNGLFVNFRKYRTLSPTSYRVASKLNKLNKLNKYNKFSGDSGSTSSGNFYLFISPIHKSEYGPSGRE